MEGATSRLENRGLRLLLVVVSAAFAWVLMPFWGTILWGAIIALVFAPVHRGLLRRLRYRRTPAALLTLLVVVIIAIVPFVLLSTALAREAIALVQRVQSGEWNAVASLRHLADTLPAPLQSLLERFGWTDADTLQRRLAAAMAQGSQFIAARALGIGQDTFVFIGDLLITGYIAFFLLRDGDTLVDALRGALPLQPAHKRELVDKFATVIRAMVKGSLLVAAVQGALGGLAFWFLGVGGALLWAVLMAFLALLPAIGAALVWMPVAIWFFLTGALWQGAALLAWGLLVIGLIDNLMRPALVGKDTRMPDYVVMITTLGGMAAFGLNGFVAGPVIGAMFIAVWHIHLGSRADATAEDLP